MRNSLQARLRELDWRQTESELRDNGHSLTSPLLTPDECHHLVDMYANDSHFRSHILMARYRFGSGDYKYFSYPLPEIVNTLRTEFYPHLARVAKEWNQRLGIHQRFPQVHQEFIDLCHARGQTRPTPLLLHYQAGDYNCLHQDLYGDIAFPLQLTCFLTDKREYSGGEFVLVEQQPRAQSRPEVLTPEQGQILVFTTKSRPIKGNRGYYRVSVRHGVSRIRSGIRYTLGVPFHDAA